MVEYDDLKPQRLDNLLAEFTDRLMNMDVSDDLLLDSQDQELRALQDTVILLKRALVEEQPSPATAERIHGKLVMVWRRSHQEQVSAPGLFERLETFLDDLRRTLRLSRQRSFALGFAAVVVVVMLVVLFAAPEGITPPVGTAGGSDVWLPLVILLVAVFVLGLLWLLRRRN